MLAYFFALKQSILFRDHLIRRAYMVGITSNFLSWILLAWAALARIGAREIVALHTTIYFGIDLVGSKTSLFFYPLLGLIILFGNAAAVLLYGKKDVFLARSSGFITAGLEASLLAGSVWVVLLNL